MEPKTVNQYLDQILSLPVSEREPEAAELIALLQRLKFDFGGNKVMRPLVSNLYFTKIQKCLRLEESGCVTNKMRFIRE